MTRNFLHADFRLVRNVFAESD